MNHKRPVIMAFLAQVTANNSATAPMPRLHKPNQLNYNVAVEVGFLLVDDVAIALV